ncbi:hypothetical protein [Bradyrhizobium roseum]|uniref:hypothetical protein n=1 Tax=Bradyrhizobium roseum TaxID=3056648 RepID=UPI0026279A8C|nr:hypothetical protein [Bradyrhizobium roseus]WKA31584.1 hypothetical protein QUH67_16115 [Bradyrhizobium roseus]
MKATIESTDCIVEISDPSGRRASARVWEGVTEGGVKFTAYITQTQVRAGAGREAEFNRDLIRSGRPSVETAKAIDHRYVV